MRVGDQFEVSRIVREVKDAVEVPVSVYNISGEYAMIKAAAKMGWLEFQTGSRIFVLPLHFGMEKIKYSKKDCLDYAMAKETTEKM